MHTYQRPGSVLYNKYALWFYVEISSLLFKSPWKDSLRNLSVDVKIIVTENMLVLTVKTFGYRQRPGGTEWGGGENTELSDSITGRKSFDQLSRQSIHKTNSVPWS